MDKLLDAANKYVGIPYGRPRRRDDLTLLDCSTFTAHVIEDLFGKLTGTQWADIVLTADRLPGRPFAPVEAVVAAGWATRGPGAGWNLVQGWRRRWSGGHALLVHKSEDGLRVLESNIEGGVKWRGSPVLAKRPLSLNDAPVLKDLDEYDAGLEWAHLDLPKPNGGDKAGSHMARTHVGLAALAAREAGELTIPEPGTPLEENMGLIDNINEKRVENGRKPLRIHILRKEGVVRERRNDSPWVWLKRHVRVVELVDLVKLVVRVLKDGKVSPDELLLIGAALVDLVDED